jgi:polysaccharide deacetylase family protein (PEP-CTERM system associated)
LIDNYLTIDVEDYYQVSAFDKICSFDKWDSYPSRVVANTEKVLAILEKHGVRATFFVLGWTAGKFPGLIKKIDRHGHELACHSYNHRLVYNLTPSEFREDTRLAKELIEQAAGRKVRGYRAPSYSINSRNLWAFEILEELGFEFDSSIFPIYHDRYGDPGAPRFRHQIVGRRIVEYPISTVQSGRVRIPVGGGGYFRLYPYTFSRWCLQRINGSEKQPFVFYLHPWELDAQQPRMRNGSAVAKFRHYVNLAETGGRFERLLQDFNFVPLHSPGSRGR